MGLCEAFDIKTSLVIFFFFLLQSKHFCQTDIAVDIAWLFIACECLGLELRNQLKRLNIYCYRSLWLIERGILHLGCVPFGESKNGFLILDLPDFSVERNVKSEIGFVTLVTVRQRVQYAR